MRALVTGASGFIGKTLVKKLAEEGNKVTALDIKKSPQVANYCDYFVIGNITDFGACLSSVKKAEVVYHLAGVVAHYSSKDLTYYVNVEGTRKILKASKNAGVKRFVFISSLAVHPLRNFIFGDESAPREGSINTYATSKRLAEELVEIAGKDGLETVIVRPGFAPFGPGDPVTANILDTLIANRFVHLNKGESLTCTSYVENLCDGIHLCGTHPKAAGETFIISDNNQIRYSDYINAFCLELGLKEPKLSLPRPLVASATLFLQALYPFLNTKNPLLTRYLVTFLEKDICFFSGKAEKLIGYCPKIELPEAVHRTVEWYKYSKNPETKTF